MDVLVISSVQNHSKTLGILNSNIKKKGFRLSQVEKMT